MKTLVGCKLPDSALDELRSLGTELIYQPDLTTAQLEKLIGDVAILVVCRTRVSREAISAGRSLQLIVRAGTNTANIAIEEASAAGIFVCNCPDKDAAAVAELMLGFLIALDRRLPQLAGVFDRGAVGGPACGGDARGLAGRTLGLLGFGAAQRELARRAQACHVDVLVWAADLSQDAASRHGVRACSWPRELARQSDMIAAHVPRQEADGMLVDAEFLENMRPGAYLVFAGHPAGLDTNALAEIAPRRKLRVACDLSAPQLTGSDTGRFKNRLGELPDVLATFGLADRTQQAWEATAAEVVRVVREFLVAGTVRNCVNLLESSPATWQLLLRLRDTVGVMAAIMDHIRADGINAQEIQARVFAGAKAAWCVIALDERPSAEGLDAIRKLDGVLHLELRALV